METRELGSLNVSVTGLGCNNFGRRLDLAGTKSVLDAAIAAGVTFLDTADTYGDTRSEELMGEALKGRRSEVLLATKFGMPNKAAGLTGGARPDYIHASIDASLKRLQTDHVDLYQLHKPDPDVPIADTLGALGELVQAGKVREIGCSNFSAEQMREAHAAAEQDGTPRFVSVQNEYNLMRRQDERTVIPAARELGVGHLPYYPLMSGILTGKYRKNQPLPEGTRVRGSEMWESLLTEQTYDLIEALITFANARERELIDLAFAWLLAEPAVKSVIAGAMSPAQIQRNAQAASWSLTRGEKEEVDALLTMHGFTPDYPPSVED